jgi:translation initiation factor IF-3
LAIKRKRSRKAHPRSLEPPRRTQPAIRANGAIRAETVRLVDVDGTQLGIQRTDRALAYAEDRGLDLVEVAASADPPVCRVMDYAKFRYQEEQKAKQTKRNRTQVSLKEIRLRPRIGSHDYTWKKRRLSEFLEGRSKVKVVVLFRGREREHPERGRALLERLAEDVRELGDVEAAPTFEGRSMSMVVAPRTSP